MGSSKSALFLFALFSIINASVLKAQSTIYDNIKALYNLNGNARDISGNNPEGIVYGATPSSDRYGQGMSAFYFNGRDNYIDLQNSSNIQTAEITFSFWFKTAIESPETMTLLTSKSYGYSVSITNGYLEVNAYTGTNGNSKFSYTKNPQKLSNNYWHNIAISHNGSSFKIYLNSQLIHTDSSLPENMIYYGDGEVVLGRNGTNGDSYYKGFIDQLIFFDKALSPQEIALLTYTPTGSGTKESPYEIETLTDLFWLSQTRDAWDKQFIQTADIDATETNTWHESSGTYLGFSPIGNSSLTFFGSYDGQGHSISNLYINREEQDYVGLFGFIENSTIKNLHLKNATIKARDRSAALAGQTIDHSLVEGCSADAEVQARSHIGVLVGYNWAESTISACQAHGSVTASGSNAGGICGYNDNQSIIEMSVSTADATANIRKAGSLCGYNYNRSIIRNCYATGNARNNNAEYQAGGLVGMSQMGASIINSYATGKVFGEGDIGAFIGTNLDSCTISNCWVNSETTNTTSLIGADMNNQIVHTGNSEEIADQNTFKDWDFSSTWYIAPEINDGFPTFQYLWQASPQNNMAIKLDGADDYIKIPYSKFLNPSKFTFSIWAKTEQVTAGEYQIVYNSRAASTSEEISDGINMYISPTGTWKINMGKGELNDYTYIEAGFAIPSKWHYLSMSYDGSWLRFYINGELIGEKESDYAPNTSKDQTLGERANLNLNFNGTLDNAELWNNALSQEEIKANMYHEPEGNETGLVAYFDFDFKDGIIFNDKTGKHTAFLTNMTGDEWVPRNQNAPKLVVSDYAITENSPKGSIIGTLSGSDADAQALAFSTTDKRVDVSPEGVISIADSSGFDFETNSYIKFIATVSDGTKRVSKYVQINIIDDPDDNIRINRKETITACGRHVRNGKVYTQSGIYTDTLKASAGNDSTITLNITITPLFELCKYATIVSGENLSFGDTVLNTSGIYQRIFTSKDGCDSTVTLHLDIATKETNKHAPQFTSLPDSLFIKENLAEETVIANIKASDADGDQLIYSIEDTSGAFFMNSYTGYLSVMTPHPLDYESATEFSITVKVSDGDIIKKRQISISLLDVFEPLHISDVNQQSVFPKQVRTGQPIQVNADEAFTEIRIYSPRGSLVYSNKITGSLSIPTDKLLNGIYLLQFYSKDNIITHKIFIRN